LTAEAVATTIAGCGAFDNPALRGRMVKTMSVSRLATAAAVAAMLAAPVLLSASDKALPSNDGKAVQKVTVEKAPATQFATLKGVKAVPMAAKELDAVKGMHVHFLNPGNNTQYGEEGLHLAGIHNFDNWSNLYGDGFVAPSYHGLCVARTTGSAILIGAHEGCGP
jgi:hypothetical protein